jgi:N-acetylglucosamine-6-phosphate deacetylase
MRTLIHSARLVSGGHITEDGWVLFEGDTISALGAGRPPVPAAPADVVDASRRWLTPGFIDIHCHGGGGASFDEGIEGARTALAVHRAHGTTRSVLSLVTAPLSDLGFRLRLISALSEADPLVLGAHLEGPFLDPGHSGAHDPSLLRPPTRAAIDTRLEAGAFECRLRRRSCRLRCRREYRHPYFQCDEWAPPSVSRTGRCGIPHGGRDIGADQ